MVLNVMAKLILLLATVVSCLTFGQINTPARLSCLLQKTNSHQMTFPRLDALETSYPFIYTLTDTKNNAFKNILSHQIVYSSDDVFVVFIAAEDSQGSFGVYRIEINNSLKLAKTQFLNYLPPKLKELKNLSTEIPYHLFALSKGLLLYPANEIGVWKLINLSTGAMVHQWIQPIGFHNPQIMENYAAWTYKETTKTQLILHDLNSDGTQIVGVKGDIQLLNVYKNNIFYLNIENTGLNSKTYRAISSRFGVQKIYFQLNSANANYYNFLMVNNVIFYSSEKSASKTDPSAIIEAQINVFDVTKNRLTQTTKYANFMVDLLKKFGTAPFRLLHQPLWNRNEIVFSLNEIGGLVKYNYTTQQWYYLGYPYEGNTCFEPTLINFSH
jgi:hypothetical protein